MPSTMKVIENPSDASIRQHCRFVTHTTRWKSLHRPLSQWAHHPDDAANSNILPMDSSARLDLGELASRNCARYTVCATWTGPPTISAIKSPIQNWWNLTNRQSNLHDIFNSVKLYHRALTCIANILSTRLWLQWQHNIALALTKLTPRLAPCPGCTKPPVIPRYSDIGLPNS